MIDLRHGDCLEVMKELEDDSIDLVLTDPPYGVTDCKWDSVVPFDKMWEQLNRITKQSSPIIFTAGQPFTSALVMSNPNAFRHEWIWLKNRGSNFANTVREPFKEHESVLVFCQSSGWTYNKQMQERTGGGIERTKYLVGHNDTHREGTRQFEGRDKHEIPKMRIPSSYQKFNVPAGKEKVKHATQKPVKLMEYLINTYSNEGDVVLDFTMGSGTTGVACKCLNRSFIGIDIDEKYVRMTQERIDDCPTNLFGEFE